VPSVPATPGVTSSEPPATPPKPPVPVVPPKPPAPAAPVEFKVLAKNVPTNPLATGIRLAVGDVVVLAPNADDRWGAKRGGKHADYRGVPLGDHMAMRWKIGQSTGMVVSGKQLVATEAG
jgi:hypothetical protein